MNQQDTKTPPADNVDAADSARKYLADLDHWVDKANTVPDLRMEKIEKVKESIARGDYQPSATDIADAIIKSEE